MQPGGQIGKLGHGAGDGLQPCALPRTKARAGAKQALRIGMSHAREHGIRRAAFDDGAAIHHHHALHILGDDAEIVRDQNHRHAALGNEVCDQIEDLSLDGDVERRGRLIGDQHVGLAGQRHGNGHALPLAPGELVRIGIDAFRRIGKPDTIEQGDGFLACLCRRAIGVAPQRLGHLTADRVHRIERGHRLLEDHADAIAAQLAVIRIRQAHQLAAVEADAAADDGAVGQQAHQRERGDGFAAAGFADETQGLAALQRETDAANGLRGTAAGVEPDAEIPDFDQRRVS